MPTCGFTVFAARRAVPHSFPLTRDVGLLVLQRFVRAFKATQPLLDVSPDWRYGQANHLFREKYPIELREGIICLPTCTGGGVEALAWGAANQTDLLKEWMKWHR